MRRKQFYLDMLERCCWTFVQAGCAAWLVTQSLDRETLMIALVAGLAAVAKCLMAVRIGDGGTASTLRT